MHIFALALALLLAFGIVAIGGEYLLSPATATRRFGLPPPVVNANLAWWLRLTGVRDVVSGLVLLAFLARGDSGAAGLFLLVMTLVPLGDMSVVLGGGGSRGAAFGIHGATAVAMLVAAVPLLSGGL